jgi:GNAT superfamily N-acetyltransferase
VGEIRYVTLTADLAPALAQIELTAFPEADPAGLLDEEDIRVFAEVFPEGYIVAMDGDRPVGMGAGVFVEFDFETQIQHTIESVCGPHQCANHDPEAPWYYGVDLAVLPEYRGRGIGRALYDLRKDLVQRHRKRGIIAGGDLPGWPAHQGEMDVETYVAKVVAGELTDATLTMQLRNGFEVRGVIHDYLAHSHGEDFATLIVWENPDWADAP